MHLHATALQSLRNRVHAEKSLNLEAIHTEIEEEMLAAGVIVDKAGEDDVPGLYFYVPNAPDPEHLREQYDICTVAIDEQAMKGVGPVLKALGMARPIKAARRLSSRA